MAVPSTYIDSLRFQMTMQSLQAEICALVATNFAYFGGTDQDISNLFQACSQEQSNEKEELCQNARTLASENEVDHSSPRQANSMQRGGIADDGYACIGSTSQSPDLIFVSACSQQQPNKEEDLTQESRILSVDVNCDSLPNRAKVSDSEDLPCTTSAPARDASTDLIKEVSSTDLDPELGYASLTALAGDWFVPDHGGRAMTGSPNSMNQTALCETRQLRWDL